MGVVWKQTSHVKTYSARFNTEFVIQTTFDFRSKNDLFGL